MVSFMKDEGLILWVNVEQLNWSVMGMNKASYSFTIILLTQNKYLLSSIYLISNPKNF